jgi:hypothetical protein
MQTAALTRALEPIRRRIDSMTDDAPKRNRIRRVFDSLIEASASVRDWAKAALRGDAVNLPYAARQLEYVYETAIEVDFPVLAFADQSDPLVPWDTTVPVGARTFVWYYSEGAGSAEFFAAMGSDGLPSPTVMGAEQMGKVEPFGSEIKVRIDQLRAAAFAGQNLDAQLGKADKRGHAERLHFTAAWGREDIGLPGMLNNPQVAVSVAADGAGNSTAWAAKTPGEIIADVLGIVNSIQVASQELYAPTVIAMPARRLRVLMQTRISDGTSTDSGTTTIMEYLEKALKADGKTIRFRALEDLLAANASDYTDMFDGLDGDAGMIAFNDSPEYVSLVVPSYYEVLAVQESGHWLNTPTMSYMGGIKLPYPITVAIVVGI